MAEVNEITWDGLKAVELKTKEITLVGVYETGPRLSSLSLNGGENILLWDDIKNPKYARPVEGRETWNLRGGHRVWLAAPGADESELTYNVDNACGSCEILPDGFILEGARDPATQTVRGLCVKVIDDNRLEVDNYVKNVGDMLFCAGMWTLTCTLPTEGTRYVIPLGDGTSWNAATIVHFNEWGGHGQKSFEDNQFNFEQDAMVITPKGIENKRMIESHAGVIALSCSTRDLTFAKQTDYDPDAKYPLNTNIAAYIGPDNFMVEMENMGPAKTIKPGADLHQVEKWILKSGQLESLTGAAAKSLF